MVSLRRSLFLSLLVATMVAVLPAWQPAQAHPSAGAAVHPNIEALYKLAHAHSDQYAGVAANGPDDITVMVVNGTGASGAAANAIKQSGMGAATGATSAKGAGVTVRTLTVQRSAKQMLSLQDKLNKEIVAGVRPYLVGTGVDVRANKVEVYSLNPELAKTVLSDYPGQVVVKYGTAGTAVSGRQSDSPAFYGGGRIRNSANSSFCTSGFAVKKSGVTYMVTDGHCFPLNTTVYNGNKSYTFGKVAYLNNGSNSLDTALISGSTYSARIFTGSNTSSSSIPVKSLGYSCGYCYVYVDGSVTGQALGKITTSDPSFGSCYIIDSHYVCGQVKVTPGSVCAHGDSGGPIFGNNGSGGATAVGVLEALFTSENSCSYTILGKVLGYWGATLNIG